MTNRKKEQKGKPASQPEAVEFITPRFADFEHKLRALPADLTEIDVVGDDFLLAREGPLEVFYAPLHGVTPDAEIVIVGLTPGRSQMLATFREARRLLHDGWHPPQLFGEVRHRITFGGTMRTNLIRMLDRIGVAERLELETCADLFGSASRLLHSTSALRYPVFFKGNNYRGAPKIGNSKLLSNIVKNNLPNTLKRFPNAQIVPLGRAVEEGLQVAGVGESSRILKGFPHPSGANGHRIKQFKSEYRRLRSAVSKWKPLSAGS